VPGYWREEGERWQWVPGFWTEAAATQDDGGKQVTYFPAPPAPPQTAPPGPPPNPDTFYVPGYYVWTGQSYAWRGGYWARVQPGYIWVPAHYRWTPYGYVFIAGYWDHAVRKRGILYAPVVVDTVVVGPQYVYTPAYAVADTMVLDTMFVRPCYCHYYFGDYYEPRYREYGFESCVVYSQRNYDSIVVYRTWEYRDNPRWIDIQINLFSDRYAGRAPVPPRTLVQQNTIINQTVINNNTTIVNNTVNNMNVNNVNVNNVKNVNTVNNMQMLAPTSQVAKAQGMTTVPMDPAVRQQAAAQARTVQQAAVQQRQMTEGALKGSPPTAPRTAAMKVPAARTVSTLPAAAAASPQNPGNRPNPQATGSAPNTKAATAPGGATSPAAQHTMQGAGQTPQTAAKSVTPGAPQTGTQPGSNPAAPHTGLTPNVTGTTAPAAGLQHPQTAGTSQTPQTAGTAPTTGAQPASKTLNPGQPGTAQQPNTFGTQPGIKPPTTSGQSQPATGNPPANPNGVRALPYQGTGLAQPNTLQRPQTLQGSPPSGIAVQPRPPFGAAPAGTVYPPNGQRPAAGALPPGAQRPPPAVNGRPQPGRPAPPPPKKNSDDKKKNNN
jgi:hypothetical protein